MVANSERSVVHGILSANQGRHMIAVCLHDVKFGEILHLKSMLGCKQEAMPAHAVTIMHHMEPH